MALHLLAQDGSALAHYSATMAVGSVGNAYDSVFNHACPPSTLFSLFPLCPFYVTLSLPYLGLGFSSTARRCTGHVRVDTQRRQSC